jgi:glutaminase
MDIIMNPQDYQAILERIYAEVQGSFGVGKVASYIPELASIDPNQFGMAIATIDGALFQIGNASMPFSIQSISKVFALSLAFDRQGESLWSRVRKEPSGNAFNSIVQLEYEKGIPRNPFINAGAILVTDVLCSAFMHPETSILNFVRKLSQNTSIEYNMKVASSELNNAHRNLSIAHLMKSFNNLENKPEHVIKTYCTHCATEMSCVDLAKSGLYLANDGIMPSTKEYIINDDAAKRINAIMLTCGAYDAAGDLAYRIGFPLKTGVGGGILAVIPGVLSVCVWSPALDEVGNSFIGCMALEKLSLYTNLSVF